MLDQIFPETFLNVKGIVEHNLGSIMKGNGVANLGPKSTDDL